MLSDDDVRKLIAAKSETANVDYKEGFAWTAANRDKKYELIRDLYGMANTKDGGRVILGVKDKTFELVGVSDEIYGSFDPNGVVQMAHDNADPKVVCQVSKHEIDGKNVVVLDVAEFSESPIICTNSINSTQGNPRVILREGAIYVRTSAALTEEVKSQVEMNSLIGRAMARKKDALLHDIQALLGGQAKPETPDAKARYQTEMSDAIEFVARAVKAQ